MTTMRHLIHFVLGLLFAAGAVLYGVLAVGNLINLHHPVLSGDYLFAAIGCGYLARTFLHS